MNILNLFGISDAFAQTADTHSAGGGLFSLLPMLIIIFVFMYFVMIRPQSKRAKEHRALLSNLAKGDEVVTNGGIVGKVEKLSDDFVILSVSEGVNIHFQKAAISAVLPKGTTKTI